MSQADLTRPGVWAQLFPKALGLMRHMEKEAVDPLWTFGGETVLDICSRSAQRFMTFNVATAITLKFPPV